jgi:prepilin-type N-terminal cleavage/methylation domain-containing protein
MLDKFKNSSAKGFTLIETLIGAALFVIIASAVYFSYSNILDIVIASQLNLSAQSALNREVEIIRNIPYDDVGIQGGSPVGILQAQKNITVDGAPFILNTFVRNIDDPFDGTIGGAPNDTAPADYKLIELELTCPSCSSFVPARITTTVAPENLENTTGNGALFINVFDAYGVAVSGADVSIINNQTVPTISINDTTNTDGKLQLVDIATSSAAYEIAVSKAGYSSEQTYPIGGPGNPNPTKPHSTVVSGTVTGISFVIDKISSINLKTRDKMCANIPDVDFNLDGTKLIGVNPDVLKYSNSFTTDANGDLLINNLEWDGYNFQNNDTVYEITGISSSSPFTVNPDTNYQPVWVMKPSNPKAIIVEVRDQNGILLDDASVNLTNGGFNETKISSRNDFEHIDWSGGQYDSKSVYLDTDTVPGRIQLGQIAGKYASMSDEWIISNTVDMGTSNTTFYDIGWNPISQPIQTELKFQIATNNDNLTWNFTGPDGTVNTFYSTSGAQMHISHNGNRYLRYRAILRTEDHDVTPTLEDVNFGFSSACLIIGQAYFDGLNSDMYTLTVTKTGFQDFVDSNVDISTVWQKYDVTLTP